MATEYDIQNSVLKSMTLDNDNGNIQIPSAVIKIGKGAFEGSQITSVSFTGNDLRSIEEYAFKDCKMLEGIRIPDGVVQIGNQAFGGCSGLDYIEIPESVMVFGNDVFYGCKKGLIIIGKENSEAENIAQKYGFAFRTNARRAIASIKESKCSKKTFDIFGETITCSKTLVVYHDNLEHYSGRKDSFFSGLYALIPKKVSEHFEDIAYYLVHENKNMLNRLSNHGISVHKKSLDVYLVESYKRVTETIAAIKEFHDSVASNVEEGIANNRRELLDAAESKVTGLGVGIIGDSLDIIAASIDDYRERQRQRKKAYAEAEELAAFYKQKHIDLGNQLYAEYLAKAVPVLNQATDCFMDSLCYAENQLLIKAGVIDEEAVNSIDIALSSRLISSIEDKEGDHSFSVALALKNYPCNIAALDYAKEKGYSCEGLDELIRFLGWESKLNYYLEKRRKKCFQETLEKIKPLKSANLGVKTINDVSNYLGEKKTLELLDILAERMTPLVIGILEPDVTLADMSMDDIPGYCSKSLNKIISEDTWEFFQKQGIFPVKSSLVPDNSKEDFSAFLKWLTSEVCKKEEKYVTAKEQLTKVQSKEDSSAVAKLFKEIMPYKDSQSLYKELMKRLTIDENKNVDTRARMRSAIIALIIIIVFFGLMYMMAS